MAVRLLLTLLLVLMEYGRCQSWPQNPRSIIDYQKNPDALSLQAELQPSAPKSLSGAKITPNYLFTFLSQGNGQELLDAQDKLLKAWNSTQSISKLIRDEATGVPINLPPRFKASGPLNNLLGELVVLYYATWQGVETVRREYYRHVELDQLKIVKDQGLKGLTDDPPHGKQFVKPPEAPATETVFYNKMFIESTGQIGNAVTAYSGTYLDLSKGPLVITFPKITDYYVIAFYNAYGEVIHTVGTRMKTNTAKKLLVVNSFAPKSPVESQFTAGDIVRMPGVDGFFMSRILGPQRAQEYTITPATKEGMWGPTYWWGVDPAVYYIYSPLDPLYYWKIAGLVLARNPREGLTPGQRQLLRDLHFTEEGLEVGKLNKDQKLALIAAIPIANKGMEDSYHLIGPKSNGYWYLTGWNSIPGSYYQFNAAYFKGFWLALTVKDCAYLLQYVDSEARPLNGGYDYTMNFKEPPPTNGAFWSIQTARLDQFSMADAADAWEIDRPIEYTGYPYGVAFASSTKASSGTGGLVTNADGSFALKLSVKPKPAGFEGNYLQIAGDAPFYIIMRIYNPADEVIQNKLQLPPLVRGN